MGRRFWIASAPFGHLAMTNYCPDFVIFRTRILFHSGALRGPYLGQPARTHQEVGDLGNPVTRLEVGEEEGPRAPHLAGIAVHHAEVGTDVGGEIDLVDDEEVRARDAGPAFARDLV